MMKVAIIGAGIAGLASAWRCLEKGFEVTVYERTKTVGGTWVYDERIGYDEFDLPIHTSMYKNLLTNLPKELMDFPNFPHKGLDNVSFLNSEQVQAYIEQFTEHFKLEKHIRFCTLVKSIERLTNTWEVIAEDLESKKSNSEYYDVVMVCNGHNALPFIPNIPGKDTFVGVQVHSHDYRIPENFKNMNILIIGSGPSGVDISADVAKFANQVYFSHHKSKLYGLEFPKNVIHKPDVEFFSENSVHFVDYTTETLDAIIYCTGFDITLSFIKPSCGINLVNNNKLITPLHKNIININNPTMGFIGFINMTFVHRAFDLQVRYYLEFLRKHFSTTEENQMTAVNTHVISHYLFDYFKSLASEEVKVEPIPQIIFKVYRGCRELREKHFRSYRSAVFKIIDDDNFSIEFDEKKCKK